MDNHFKQMTNFFSEVGADGIEHSEKTYLAHGIGVYNDLKSWGCESQVCDAGLFHSIYGTELFQKFALTIERRGEVRALIGERAERLAYLNCAMDRPVFDETVFQTDGPHRFRDRLTAEECDLSPEEFQDLCTIQVCDWLEQVERSRNWDYRRGAYHQMAQLVGGVAIESYDRTFANETAV